LDLGQNPDFDVRRNNLKLTPLDIKRQEFKRILRGYDPVEVETFLEMVADEYEELLNELHQTQNEVITLRTQLKDYQQVEHTLKETLMNAQESINRARINTEKEANLIISEAELKAEKLLEATRHDLDKMKNELILLRSQKESFAKRLKHLLESQLELIGVLEIDDLALGKSEKKRETPKPGPQPAKEPQPPPVTEKPVEPVTEKEKPHPTREEDQMIF